MPLGFHHFKGYLCVELLQCVVLVVWLDLLAFIITCPLVLLVTASSAVVTCAADECVGEAELHRFVVVEQFVEEYSVLVEVDDFLCRLMPDGAACEIEKHAFRGPIGGSPNLLFEGLLFPPFRLFGVDPDFPSAELVV